MNLYTGTDDSELLLRLREGDGASFSAIYDRYAGLIYNRVKRLVHVHEFAEELVQDVFMQLWTNRAKIPSDLTIQIVLLRYAKSSAINFYRKAVRDVQMKEKIIQSSVDYYDPIEDEINFNETSTVLHAAIAKLPPQRQKIFILCKLEGKSYEEAATLYGVSVGTIKDHMAKAMRSLRQELGESSAAPTYLLFIAYLLS
ncbi:RNA polymerase sigma factor [Sphingobacterium faecale]|uniref:RNA polymerase sigma-70 factor n=1 Tax=Sphingobacterium faecale TaxID=2803775 RepID=A0ABS1R0L3_9SPHI|nr:RNA polymerase sigma-70 factor [Sphingobacterium faecale]MBL1408231.1 RNA polymerase sigma-70 factor [Sphingobacterium faecale]